MMSVLNKRNILYIALTLLLLSINHVISQKAYSRNDFPNPMVDLNDCGQNGRPSWICDPGNVLTQNEVQTLNDTANDLNGRYCACRTKTNCFYKMAVAVVPSMLEYGRTLDGKSNSEQLAVAQDFAKYLNRYTWNFGNCNDDLVVVLAVKEREIWTTLGDTMKKVLPAECVSKIFQDNKEWFSNEDFGQGLIKLFKSYRQIIVEGEDTYDCSSGLSAGAIVGIVFGSLFGVLIIGFFFCCCCGCCKGGGRGGRGGGGGKSSGFGRSWSFGGGGGWGGGGSDGGGGSF